MAGVILARMQSKAATVEQYLAEMPPERRAAIQAVREVMLRNLGEGYEEGMGYGMMGYYVPHSIYPAGYHCNPKLPLPFAGLANQKQHMSVYLMSLYGPDSDEAWFRDAWAATGKKLDMGKSCIRFKRVEDLALEVIGEAMRRMPVARWIEYYERAFKNNTKGKAERAASKKQGKKAAPPKGAAKPGKSAAKTGQTRSTAGKKVARKAGAKVGKKAAARR